MSLPTPRLLEPRNSRALVIMARCPRPGQCKTRLCPPLRPAEASALYGAFLEDIGREVQQLKTVCDIWVAWAGEDGDEEQVRSFFPGDVRLLQQQGVS